MWPSSSSSEMASARISRSDKSLNFFAIKSEPLRLRFLLPRIHGRVGQAHLAREPPGNLNLNQRTLANPRTPLRRFLPGAAVIGHFRPEWKQPALSGFRLVDRAPIRPQKTAQAAARNAQAAEILGAVDEAFFEFPRSDAEILRRARHIFDCQINETFALAAGDATGLACEAQRIHGSGYFNLRMQKAPGGEARRGGRSRMTIGI